MFTTNARFFYFLANLFLLNKYDQITPSMFFPHNCGGWAAYGKGDHKTAQVANAPASLQKLNLLNAVQLTNR